MRLLDLDDDSLSRVAEHLREHAAFTTLVCKRLLRLTQEVFHPHPVTCTLGTVVQCQATYEVYKHTHEVKRRFESVGSHAFTDACLLYGNEDFVMQQFPEWAKRTDALLSAGRVDILEKAMGIPGKPETTQSSIYVECRELRSSLLNVITFLGIECGDCGCLFREKHAVSMNLARRYLNLVCMAPGPASLRFILDWVDRLTPHRNRYIDALLETGTLQARSLVGTAISKGGPGNLAYIYECMLRSNARTASNANTDDVLFPWICSVFVDGRQTGHAAWEYMSAVDWKARGCTLRSAVQRYNEVVIPLLNHLWWLKPVVISCDLFKIRDQRSLDIVKAALRSKDSWLLDAFQEACEHIPSLEYVCLFNSGTINISVVWRCVEHIALSYILFDDASSGFVTSSMFKLSRMDACTEASDVVKITHYSCLLISELWEAAIADGRPDVLKRMYKVIIRNNFLFHTLVLAFKWKQLRTIGRFLTRTPQAGISLDVGKRDYLVQQSSMYYPPEALAHTVAKLLAVSLDVAHKRCCEFTPQVGKRKLPDFQYHPHR
tara:strand:- start:3882 stop:5525 length:1644 start_codon:yes stop_codon:yes gene_type:complete